MKNKKFDRQPQTGPPPSSQSGAPGASLNEPTAPPAGAVGNDRRGKFDRQPQTAPPPSSQSGAPGASLNEATAPQGGAVPNERRRRANPVLMTPAPSQPA